MLKKSTFPKQSSIFMPVCLDYQNLQARLSRVNFRFWFNIIWLFDSNGTA